MIERFRRLSWRPANRRNASVGEARPDWRSTLKRRVAVAATVLSLWAAAIEVRLVVLQIVEHDELVDRAERQQVQTRPLNAKRGDIVDRNGKVLATSVDADTIYAVPSAIEDEAATVKKLCAAFGDCTAKEKQDLVDRLKRQRHFAYVRRQVSQDVAAKVTALNLDGIGFIKESHREYPNNELLSHVLGFVGLDGKGLGGLESAYDGSIRGKDGQAREFNNYMLPVDMGGTRVFLAGVRGSPNDPFRYMRIPADSQDSIGEWMRLRAALEDPAVRADAAARFAQRSLPTTEASLRGRLQDSAFKVLTLFAASDDSVGRGADGQPIGGFQAVATFIDRSVPKAEQEKAASLLLRMLEGSMWEVWQIARERAGEPAAQQGTDTIRFVQNAINALSDSFLYGSPVYLQLDSFKQVQASVFQLTRAPGKNLVYLGSLLLVAGIFSMFYVRERRLWFWLKDAGSGVDVVMAMSTARKTFDFEKEFVQTRDAAGAALRAAPRDAAPAGAAATARPPAGGGSDSENSTR